MYEGVPDVKLIFVTIERLEAVLLSKTNLQHYRGTWEGTAREGENGRGENERGFDEFLWESNVQLKCGAVYLLEVVG